MLSHIKQAEEMLASNLNPLPYVIKALHAMAERFEALGHEATGEVGEEVNDLDGRIKSLTSAVNSLGSTVGEIVPRVEAIEQASKTQAALSAQIGTAVPPVPPQA